MTQLQMVYTLRSGTQERWRRLSQEVAGSRRAQFEASCRQAGITQVQVWLVQLPRSELLVLSMSTQEPQQTFEALATSERPFEHWLREQLQVLLGWDVQEVLPVPQRDLLLAWSSKDPLCQKPKVRKEKTHEQKQDTRHTHRKPGPRIRYGQR